jgi:hypothetical protein
MSCLKNDNNILGQFFLFIFIYIVEMLDEKPKK